MKPLKKYLLPVLTAICTIYILLLAFSPIIDRDALILHMAFPKIWQDKNFLFFNSCAAGDQLSMMNLDYIYMLLLKIFEYENLPKNFHASLLIFTGLALYVFLKDKYSKNFGYLAFIFMATIPINQRLASEVYVDLGVLFGSALAIIFYVRYYESDFECKKNFYLMSVFTGLTCGVKYNGFIFAFFLGLLLIFDLAKKHNRSLPAIKQGAVFTLIIIITISPWLYRNYIGSGNPLHPLFNNFWNVKQVYEKPVLPELNNPSEFLWRSQENKSISDYFLLPFKFFYDGEDNNFLKFDGVLNIFLILLLPFAFLHKNDKLSKSVKVRLLILFALILFTTIYTGKMRIRYAIAILTPLVILDISALHYLFGHHKKKMRIAGLALCLGFLAINLNYSNKLLTDLDLTDYYLGNESKENYLSRKIELHNMYKYINSNTQPNSVIYEVLGGHRTYYIDRTVAYYPHILDWQILNTIYKGSTVSSYYELLNKIPYADNLKATHLLIKPNGLINVFKTSFYNEKDSLSVINDQKLLPFVEFINMQKPLVSVNGAALYEIDWNKYQPGFIEHE